MEYLKAFLVGGSLCLIGQILIDKTQLTPAKILVGYVVIGAFLSGIGVYERWVEFAQAGATVPLSGFGHNLVQGVRKAVDEQGFLGILCGGLTASSGGIATAILSGLLVGLVFRAKDKT